MECLSDSGLVLIADFAGSRLLRPSVSVKMGQPHVPPGWHQRGQNEFQLDTLKCLMSTDPAQQQAPTEFPEGPNLRFGTGTLLFVFTLFILVAASCGGLVRMGSVDASDAKMMIFALPLGGMVIASLVRGLVMWVERRSR